MTPNRSARWLWQIVRQKKGAEESEIERWMDKLYWWRPSGTILLICHIRKDKKNNCSREKVSLGSDSLSLQQLLWCSLHTDQILPGKLRLSPPASTYVTSDPMEHWHKITPQWTQLLCHFEDCSFCFAVSYNRFTCIKVQKMLSFLII